MDDLERFSRDRDAAIQAYEADTEFQKNSLSWVLEAMSKRYVYNFDWLGRPIIQYPQDMQALQEIVWQTRPDVIVETGIAHGGSLIFSASMLALLDYADAAASGRPLVPGQSARKVIGVDIDIRAHNRPLIEGHPLAGLITMFEGSSVDPTIAKKVRDAIPEGARVMVCLDSHHEEAHVLAELDTYANLVSPGCYCVVLDTFIEDAPTGFIADRPWDVGNNPKTAVHKWLPANPGFEIDRHLARKLMITGAPDGYLKRVH